MIIFVFDRVENIVSIVRKGKNAGYQHFLHFHHVFKSPSYLQLGGGKGEEGGGFIKSQDCVVKG